MSDTLEDFARRLSDSGLMPATALHSYLDGLPPTEQPQSAEELSRRLVDGGVLTEYQVETLSSDGADPLLLGDYEILEEVGSGGMGVVYRARHRRMKRVVALKMLPASVCEDELAVKRFMREVEVAAQLNHRNIVAALDAREEQGTHYLVMEFVEGRDLATLVQQEGPLSLARALHYILQAAAGCAYAHDLGVIHRDIKPANLLVDDQDVVKILDMGLARRILTVGEEETASLSSLTNAGLIMGTLDYLSPEQALNSRDVDHRTDIYSLGCTLFYLLVGRPIYDGGTPLERLIAHREKPIPSLADVCAEAAPAWDAAFRRMVAKRPEDRFGSMHEVIRALEDRLGGVADEVAIVPDDPLPVTAEIVGEPIPGPPPAAASVRPSGSSEAQTVHPARSNRPARAAILVLLGRIAGAVLGGFGGASLGSLFGELATLLGVLLFIWFGGRMGAGYARLLAFFWGWTRVPPEATSGKLFRPCGLPWHGAFILGGAVIGYITGGLGRGILVALALLALIDKTRRRPAANDTR
jgi:serine/threonine protein kinase